MPLLTSTRDTLAAIHPAAPWLTLTLATFLACYALRRFAPALWLRFFSWVPASAGPRVRDALQAFVVASPATAISAMAAGGSVLYALAGLLAGLLAPVVHLILKALPVRYQGALGARIPADLAARLDAAEKRYRDTDPPTTLLVILAVVAATHGATACASVPAKGPCSAEERAKLSAIYLAELAAYCGGKGESCPYLPEIDARHEARRKEWVSCQP